MCRRERRFRFATDPGVSVGGVDARFPRFSGVGRTLPSYGMRAFRLAEHPGDGEWGLRPRRVSAASQNPGSGWSVCGGESACRGDHRSGAFMDGVDDLSVIDPP